MKYFEIYTNGFSLLKILLLMLAMSLLAVRVTGIVHMEYKQPTSKEQILFVVLLGQLPS